MPDLARRNVAILGSTGSIGTATLEVLQGLGDPYHVWAVTAHRQRDLLQKQIRQFRPARAVLTDPKAERLEIPHDSNSSNAQATKLFHGPEALEELVSHSDVDIVVAGIVGSAGLASSLAAGRAGKTLALANKESLVVAGSLMMDAVQSNGARLLPIDSEHSAVFQALASGQSLDQVKRIILTASGGSLREMPIEQLENATIEQALTHPTWSMGRKITVDSATMMNKSLEIIEARWLFNIAPEKISVVIHPQSVIHSMVEFIDGSVVAQLCPPDMRLPIQYALTYPDRLDGPARRVDWTVPMALDWKPADLNRYPALRLGYEVAAAGGTAGAVLNGANEAAVELFLDGQIRFTDIEKVCRIVIQNHTYDPTPNLDDLLSLDVWARAEVLRWKQLECKILS